MTADLTKTQLNTILSALHGKPRNPNTKDAALKAIAKHGESLGLTVNNVLAAAAGLLDGRQSAEEFVAMLSEPDASRPEEPVEEEAIETAVSRTRAGTKQAKMIAMLRRPDGATVDQIAEVTGWQRHTIRGAMSGALKKKLGLTIESEKIEGRGRIYRIAG